MTYTTPEWLDPEDTVNPLREQWNKQAFEDLQRLLEERDDKIFELEKEVQRVEGNAEELKEELRSWLAWIKKEEEKYQETEGKAQKEIAFRFFDRVLPDIEQSAKEHGIKL